MPLTHFIVTRAYNLQMVNQTITKLEGLICNMRILLHVIDYVVIFIVL